MEAISQKSITSGKNKLTVLKGNGAPFRDLLCLTNGQKRMSRICNVYWQWFYLRSQIEKNIQESA